MTVKLAFQFGLIILAALVIGHVISRVVVSVLGLCV